MATINELIDIEQHTIKWAIDLMRADILIVDNSFQRNYVWLKKHQIKLIETILLGFPIPEIYLWQRETIASTGETKHSVIDGQQRLGAILDYINDDYELKSNYIDRENQKLSFVGKKFSELKDEEKNSIWKFKLSIRLVHDSVDRGEIVKMFLRLNSTSMSLNPQELRNAGFDGLFLQLAEEISANEFWNQHGIFNLQDRRRMNDIQFISSILLFFRLGISEDTTQENFNRVYDLYNEEYKEKDDDRELFAQILSEVTKAIGNDKEIEKFLKRKTHLYSIFLIAYYFIRKQGGLSDQNIKKLREFVDAYNDDKKLLALDENLKNDILDYKALSSKGTQSKANRMKRNDILKKILE